MELFKRDDHLEKLGTELIEKYECFEQLKNANIGYLYSDKEKKSGKKKVFAECYKVSGRERFYSGHDFEVVFYEPNLVGVSDVGLERLMFHELLHANFEDYKASINKHDLEDFKVLVDTFGTDWING